MQKVVQLSYIEAFRLVPGMSIPYLVWYISKGES